MPTVPVGVKQSIATVVAGTTPSVVTALSSVVAVVEEVGACHY